MRVLEGIFRGSDPSFKDQDSDKRQKYLYFVFVETYFLIWYYTNRHKNT